VDVEYLFDLKVHCLSSGIRVDPGVVPVITRGGELPLTIHEYATTGGVTIKIDDFYLNAPFDDWYCERSRAVLALGGDGQLEVRYADRAVPCEVLLLPGYLNRTNALGRPVVETTMSHGDRIRVSPISGCTLDCRFCDLPALRYTRHSAEQMLASIEVAKADRNLPAHHMLISGGSPGPAHFDWFDDTLVEVIANSGLPTDVMMSPREGDLDYIERYARAGVHGFSFNLEVYGQERALEIMPRKHTRSTPHLARTIETALSAVGGSGRVRSIVIVGLEEIGPTLEAIDFIASLGADPVLSPFRPAQNTQLERWEPPTEAYLRAVHDGALAIADTYGVRLGPRCIPCQHNVLVMPDGTSDYWYSANHPANTGVAATSATRSPDS
jgi:pyruvate-formate lyase-activating enzyme